MVYTHACHNLSNKMLLYPPRLIYRCKSTKPSINLWVCLILLHVSPILQDGHLSLGLYPCSRFLLLSDIFYPPHIG